MYPASLPPTTRNIQYLPAHTPQITVILRNMFSPDEFITTPGYKEELEGDLKAECGKVGKVDKVR